MREIQKLRTRESAGFGLLLLLEAHRGGPDRGKEAEAFTVEMLLDKSNEQEQYSDLSLFVEKGLSPLVDARHAIAHNKVMVIDRRTLLTGSFNFTHQAEAENAENLLIIKHHPELVEAYRQDFEAHKSHSQAPGTKAAHAPEHAGHRKAA